MVSPPDGVDTRQRHLRQLVLLSNASAVPSLEMISPFKPGSITVYTRAERRGPKLVQPHPLRRALSLSEEALRLFLKNEGPRLAVRAVVVLWS